MGTNIINHTKGYVACFVNKHLSKKKLINYL